MPPTLEIKKESGPVEVIESRGIRIPIYLNPRRGKESYLITYFAKGARKRERVSNLADARRRAKALLPELLEGKVHVSSFTLKQTTAITDAVEILAPLHVSITEVARQFAQAHQILNGRPVLEAVEFYAKHLAQETRRGTLAPITLPDLVEQYLKALNGQKSKRYIEDLRAKLNRAAKAFTGQIRDIRAIDIDQWIAGMQDTGRRTKNNYRMAMVTLFSYARDKSYLPRGEQNEAEFVTRYDDKKDGIIGIYTPKQFSLLLRHVNERFLPFVALGGFAGLRSVEILRLEWTDVWFKKGFIEVGRDKSKTATRRLVPICPALEKWLKPYAKASGPILADIKNESRFTRQFNAVRHTLNDDKGKPRVELVHNGLRHSFCSYRMAQTKSAAQVALEAGNSPKMLFEHYRELVTEAEAREWFSLTPQKVSRVIS